MMHINVNGERIDLKRGQSITIQAKNPLFSFDAMQCERTTEFSLPLTAKNMRIFGLSHDPHGMGNGMRVRYDAQLIDGLVVHSGYLYITGYSGGEYTAAMVFGSLLELKRIKEAGKIGDYIPLSVYARYTDTPKRADDDEIDMFDFVKYKSDSGAVLPSWSIYDTVATVASAIGVRVAIPAEIKSFRAIITKLQRLGNQSVVFRSEASDGTSYTNKIWSPVSGLIGASVATIEEYHTEAISVGGGYYTESKVIDDTKNIMFFSAENSLILTFPDDFPSNYYIVYGSNPIAPTASNLAGRSITISKGQKFLFMAVGDIVVEETGGPYYEEDGSSFYTERITVPLSVSHLTYQLSIEVEPAADGEHGTGEIEYLKTNMPDMTLIDLLKAIAYLTGNVLYYDSQSGITFERMGTWYNRDVSKQLISIDKVERTFADYAQVNTVAFDSWDNALDVDTIQATYTIRNANIEASKELATIKFSEGGRDVIADSNDVWVRDSKAGSTHVICRSGSGEYLTRVSLPKNVTIQRLCDYSTAIEVKLHMSHYQFSKITPKTLLLVNGIQCVWTDAQWSDGVCKMSLSKYM